MTHPSDDELAALLVGAADLPPGITLHIADCERCRSVLVELADIELRLPDALEAQLSSPPRHLWERIRAATADGDADADADGDARAGTGADAGAPARYAVSSVGAGATAGTVSLADRREQRLARPGTAGSRWLLGAAAAAALVLAGVGIGRITAGTEPGGTQLAAATLRSLDGVRVLGTAEIVRADAGSRLHVHPAAGSTQAPSGGYVEVWLLNVDGKRMVSVGVLATADEAILAVPAGALEDGYRIVDLSHELYDDKPTHSGDSIMRGTLAG